MLKKDITYEDFDGNEVTETHYFHLAKSELVEFNLVTKGGLEANFNAMLKAGNVEGVLDLFKQIIKRSYGRRDPENPQKFSKTPEILDNFVNSGAFDALYVELMTHDSAGMEFISGIFPKSMQDNPEVKTAIAKAYSGESRTPTETLQLPEQPSDETTFLDNPRDENGDLLPWAFREPTSSEMQNMSRLQMAEVYQRKSRGWVPRD